MFSILVQSLLCFQIAAELGLWWEEALARRGREGERGRRQAGSSTPNTATVKVESTEREKSVKKGGEMGQGQKGSSDKKEGKKKRDESPAPEDGHKCRFCRFPLLVALLQLLLGVAVTAVAFLMLAISPSLLARETPHWAGIIVSSILTLSHQPLHSHVCMDPESDTSAWPSAISLGVSSIFPACQHWPLPTCLTQAVTVGMGDHWYCHVLINLHLSHSSECTHLNLQSVLVTWACLHLLLFLLCVQQILNIWPDETSQPITACHIPTWPLDT